MEVYAIDALQQGVQVDVLVVLDPGDRGLLGEARPHLLHHRLHPQHLLLDGEEPGGHALPLLRGPQHPRPGEEHRVLLPQHPRALHGPPSELLHTAPEGGAQQGGGGHQELGGGAVVQLLPAVWVQGECQGSRKSLAALADKLKSHGQILTKITYILFRLCLENVGKGI